MSDALRKSVFIENISQRALCRVRSKMERTWRQRVDTVQNGAATRNKRKH